MVCVCVYLGVSECVCVCVVVPSGLSGRPSQLESLHWLLMLEVRLEKPWRGIVPMTSGNDRERFSPPGTSTYTCQGEGRGGGG